MKRTAAREEKFWTPPSPIVIAPHENMRNAIHREGRSFLSRMLDGTSKMAYATRKTIKAMLNWYCVEWVSVCMSLCVVELRMRALPILERSR